MAADNNGKKNVWLNIYRVAINDISGLFIQ
jgi:hypothetical protein